MNYLLILTWLFVGFASTILFFIKYNEYDYRKKILTDKNLVISILCSFLGVGIVFVWILVLILVWLDEEGEEIIWEE